MWPGEKVKSVEIPFIDKLFLTEVISEVDLGLIALFEDKISLAYGVKREKLLFMYHEKISLSFLNSIIKMTSLIQELIESKVKISLDILAIHISDKDGINIEIQLNDSLSPKNLDQIVEARKKMRLLNLKYSQLSQKIIMTSNDYVKENKLSTQSRVSNEL